MKKLRPYQKNALNEIVAHLFNPQTFAQRVLLQLPTGGGKTVILAKLLSEYFANKRILIVAHKIELITQTVRHLAHEGIYAAVIGNRSRYSRDLGNPVQVATVQSLIRIPDSLWPEFDLIIIDECHHSGADSYLRLFNHYRNVPFLGLTATPYRHDGPLIMFDHIVQAAEVQKLVDDGYLVPFRLLAPPGGLMEGKGKVTAEGEYKEVNESSIPTKERVVDAWLQYIPDKLTIVYPHTVEFSRAICREFRMRGISADHLDAKTPAGERELILSRFAKRETLVLCQHSIVIEGVDIPNVEAVLFLRPTQSIVTWFQAIGRALRPAEGKTEAIVLDMTSNHQSLPMPTIPQLWQLAPIITDNPVTYDRHHALKRCPNCNYSFRIPSVYWNKRVLPSLLITEINCPDCGHLLTWNPFQQKIREKDEIEDKEKREKEHEPESMSDFVVTLVEFHTDVRLTQKMYDFLSEQIEKLRDGEIKYTDFRDTCCKHPHINYDGLLVVAAQLGYKKGWAYYRAKEIAEERNLRFNYKTCQFY